MIVEIFGNVLRELRIKKDISQEKLAEYCDLDRTYISLLERGHTTTDIQFSDPEYD